MALNNFSPSTKIESSKVNENFSGLADGSEITNLDQSTTSLANPYKFLVTGAAGTQNTSAGAGYVTVQFASEYFDTNNNFNTSTYKYTTPVAGYYCFFTTVRVDSGASTTHKQVILNIAGTSYKGDTITEAASEQSGLSMTIMLYCAASADVYVQVYNSAGTSVINKQYDSRFGGWLVCE